MNSPLYIVKKYRPFYKRNLRLAFPLILTQLGQVAVALFDTYMVGLLGTTELAAVAFTNSIFLVLFIFGFGFSLGLTPHVGEAFGKHDTSKISRLLQNSFLVNTIIAIMLALTVLQLRPLLYHMGQPVEVVDTGYTYFTWLVYSMLPSLLFFTCRQFADGLGNTKISMWITLAGNLLNIGLNYLLIFGKHGFPELGVVGAGVSTFISRVFMALVYFYFLRYHRVFKKYVSAFKWHHFQTRTMKQLLATGFPISVQLIVEVMAFSLSAVMVGWIDVPNLAAHEVVLQLINVTFMTSIGVASATTIRITHLYGGGQYRAARFAANASVHLVTMFMCFTALVFIVFRFALPQIFTNDQEVIDIAAKLLIIAGLFQIFDGTQAVGVAILRGLKDVKFAMYIAFFSYAVIALPTAYILAFPCALGSTGVWLGLAAGLPVASIIYRLRFNYLMKKQ